MPTARGSCAATIDQSEPRVAAAALPTVGVVQCVECSREKVPGERGWVTVLAQARTLRINYCPECIADLVQRALPDDGVDDD